MTLSVLDNVTFFVNIQIHRTLQKIGVSAGTEETPNWHFGLQKCHFGKGASKGGFNARDSQKLHSAENALFKRVFSKTQLCRNTRVQVKKKKPKFTKNGGLFANMQKDALIVLLFLWWFCFFSVFLFFCKNAQKVIFLQLWSFFSMRSPKRPVFKIFLSFLFYIFPCFPFVFHFTFQNSIFVRFLSSTPFWKNTLFFVGLFFIVFFVNVC